MNTRIWQLTVVGLALVIAGCTTPTDGPDQGASLANFEQTGASCSSGETPQSVTELDVKDTGAVVTFNGTLTTPNPCQTLDADLVTVGENDWEVRIRAVGKPGPCIECVGAVSYQGTVSSATDTGTITFYHGDTAVSTVEW